MPVQGSGGKKVSNGEFHRKCPPTAAKHSVAASRPRDRITSPSRRDTITPTAMPTSPEYKTCPYRPPATIRTKAPCTTPETVPPNTPTR